MVKILCAKQRKSMPNFGAREKSVIVAMTVNLPRPPSMTMLLFFSLIVSLFLLMKSNSELPSFRSHRSPHIEIPLNRSVVGKVSMLYGDNPTYEAALKGHERHNLAHGYDMTVLRRQLLPGFWSKPAYILSRLLEEMAKEEADRLEWIV